MKVDTEKLEKLTNDVVKFNEARGWSPVPADIAKSLVIEAAELLEKFQWDESNSSLGIETEKKDWEEIKAELADVLWYIITFCSQTGIDINDALEGKIKANKRKYPVDKFLGKHNPAFYKNQKRKFRKMRGK